MSRQVVLDEDAWRLYEEARRRLLRSEPLRGEMGECACPLSAGEIDAMHAVGLRVNPGRAVFV